MIVALNSAEKRPWGIIRPVFRESAKSNVLASTIPMDENESPEVRYVTKERAEWTVGQLDHWQKNGTGLHRSQLQTKVDHEIALENILRVESEIAAGTTELDSIPIIPGVSLTEVLTARPANSLESRPVNR